MSNRLTAIKEYKLKQVIVMLSSFFVCKSPYLYKDIEGNTWFKTCTAIIKEKAVDELRKIWYN